MLSGYKEAKSVHKNSHYTVSGLNCWHKADTTALMLFLSQQNSTFFSLVLVWTDSSWQELFCFTGGTSSVFRCCSADFVVTRVYLSSCCFYQFRPVWPILMLGFNCSRSSWPVAAMWLADSMFALTSKLIKWPVSVSKQYALRTWKSIRGVFAKSNYVLLLRIEFSGTNQQS